MATRLRGYPCITCPDQEGCPRMMPTLGWKPGDQNPHSPFGPDHMTNEMLLDFYGTTDLCEIYNRGRHPLWQEDTTVG